MESTLLYFGLPRVFYFYLDYVKGNLEQIDLQEFIVKMFSFYLILQRISNLESISFDLVDISWSLC